MSGMMVLLSCGTAWGIAFAERNKRTGDPNNTAGFSDLAGMQFQAIKRMRLTVTTYSPNMGTNNCDSKYGGGSSTADGTGSFQIKDGRLRWVKKDGTGFEDFVFAEPTTDNIIKWSERNRYAIVLPGFQNNLAIRVRDHYQSGWHSGQDYVDMFVPCDLMDAVKAELASLPGAKNGIYDALIVDTTQPISTLSTTLSSNYSGTCGTKIVNIAKAEIGYKTKSENCSKYMSSCDAWCAAFTSWVYKQAGYMKEIHPGTVELKEQTGELQVVTVNNNISNVRPGDIFWMSANTNSGYHVGIIESASDGKVHTIEGNVTGDVVAPRTHPISQIKWVARPKSCN